MDVYAVMDQLKTLGGMSDTYHVTLFKCVRERKRIAKGGFASVPQEVTVKIFDRGPEHPKTRYSCVATREDGRGASGNPGEAIEVVLATVHWGDLDRD